MLIPCYILIFSFERDILNMHVNVNCMHCTYLVSAGIAMHYNSAFYKNSFNITENDRIAKEICYLKWFTSYITSVNITVLQ